MATFPWRSIPTLCLSSSATPLIRDRASSSGYFDWAMSGAQNHLHELNSRISLFRYFVATFPRAHPLRIRGVQALAIVLHKRYALLRQADDLEQSILHFTEAIFLPPHLDGHCLNIAKIFFLIAQLLILRAVHTTQPDTEQPEDVKGPVIYLRYLCRQSPAALNIPPDIVKEVLVFALSHQVVFGFGDLMQDSEEMADLFLELVTSDIWTISTRAITHFAGAVKSRFGRWEEGRGPPEKVIDCLRKAKIRLPNSDEVSISLAQVLLERFKIAYSNDDYEEGTTILNNFLTSDDPDDDPSQYRQALYYISMFALFRLIASGKPEHLEEAIYRFRNLLLGISLEDPDRPWVIADLKHLQSMHFDAFGVGALPENNSLDLMFSGLPSFRDLIASLEPPSMETTPQRVTALAAALRMTNMAEIEEAIEPCRHLLASFHPSDMNKSLAFAVLGNLLHRAFSLTDNFEYLNDAISTLREGLNLPHAEIFGVSVFLIVILLIRFNLRHRRDDLDEIMQLYQIVVDQRSTKIPHRFRHSCHWAQLGRISSHPSTSTAYHYALSLMQDSLTFAPTVDIQHYQLVAMRDAYEMLPLDYASYQVHTGQLQSAVQTLERGRALIWSEIRGLRSSIDQLRASEPNTADKLTAINQELEHLALTHAQNNHGDGGEEGVEGMGSFGRLVVRQQGLLDDRDKLISQIRARKGFESFLKPLSFDDLHSATVRGPVIMINHSSWRSDIIILLHDSPPSLITTPKDFYDRANKLRDQLLGAKKKGLDSFEYDDALRSVLKELYDIVGRPVIQRLNELQVPAQSRVWWCPTSVFCSLPLHAMGPIPSDSGPPRYFLDLYIPSYTPTLSALIESNKSGSQTLGRPSLLLALQPDPSMKDALGEMHVVQSINTRVKTLISARATPTAVLDHLQDHRFVHIICHGLLEEGKPFDSSFKLYQGNRLTLLNIIRSRLPNAEFAFLAACHTAELTDGSLSDEALHLTAAMQYCGFRSVVGTMWAMADTDGRHLTRNFYESVFPAGESQGVCYYERTAEALRDGVTKLRRRTTLERWVNFVHYGA